MNFHAATNSYKDDCYSFIIQTEEGGNPHFPLVSFVWLIMLMGVCVPSNADADIVGYYQAKYKKPFKFNELCIRSNFNGSYHVNLFTSYCPSEECMNARMDSIYFDALFSQVGYAARTFIGYNNDDAKRYAQRTLPGLFACFYRRSNIFLCVNKKIG